VGESHSPLRLAPLVRLDHERQRSAPGGHADLVGQKNSTVTARVYRHQLRPVINQGAEAMDAIFDQAATAGHPQPADLATIDQDTQSA
jgi:hypothetical protein